MSSDIHLDNLIEQYIQNLEAGQQVDEAALLLEHPEYADQLRSFFELNRQVQSAFNADDVPPADAHPQRLSSAMSSPTLAGRPGSREHDRDSAPSHSASAWSWNRIATAQFPVQFGEYELLEEINRGGMGVVYLARNVHLQSTVALKVMRAGEMATAEEIQRFRTEAIASSALQHPNIIPIHYAGEEHGLFYFTMMYVDGEDLERRLRNAPIEPTEAATILLKITAAVAHAHRKNVIHRDIKPSNILLDQAGEPYLADFGLAHLLAEDGMTMTGQILGTPAYMAPEQASGRVKHLTPAVDIYALGAVLYAALTRQAPFAGPTPFDILLQVIDRDPPKPSQINRDVPRALEAICLKAMAKSATERYETADDLADDLRRFLRGEPINISEPTWGERLRMWWRREPILVSHLCAVTAVMLIMVLSFILRYPSVATERFAVKMGIILSWGLTCQTLQYLARFNRHRLKVQLVWAGIDVVTYTTLMLLADPPRGLLLVGYPMMIAASGLFYRVRFVVFMMVCCTLGVSLLASLVDDPLTTRLDFIGIYIMGLVILGLCVITMIRRVRGLSQFCGASE